MAAKRKPRQTPPDRNSNRQRRRSFIRTAYQYRQLYNSEIGGGDRYTQAETYYAIRDLCRTAKRLPVRDSEGSPDHRQSGQSRPRSQNDQTLAPSARLLGTGYRYRRNPSEETRKPCSLWHAPGSTQNSTGRNHKKGVAPDNATANGNS